jgi:hypothetical protein
VVWRFLSRWPSRTVSFLAALVTFPPGVTVLVLLTIRFAFVLSVTSRGHRAVGHLSILETEVFCGFTLTVTCLKDVIRNRYCSSYTRNLLNWPVPRLYTVILVTRYNRVSSLTKLKIDSVNLLFVG